MKKISMALAIAGLGAAAMMTACTDSGTQAKKPTKAQECANGLTTECLVGEWSATGMATRDAGEMHPSFNYTAAPGQLIFKDDGSFTYIAPASAPAKVTDCPKVYGEWSVSGSTLTMKATIRNECLSKSTLSDASKIVVDASSVKLSFDGLFFLFNATDENSVRANYVETYTISAQ